MWFKKVKPKTEVRQLEYNGGHHTVKIYTEMRSNARVSLTEHAVHIRLPIGLVGKRKQKQIDTFLDWARQRLNEKPTFLQRVTRSYQDGDELQLFDKTYTIKRQAGKPSISLERNHLIIQAESDEEARNATINWIKKHYQPIISKALHQLNQAYGFGQLHKVRLKHNKSNWGSCSNKGNINISIRLFLAPKEVVNYVLIHELAHLKHPHHQPPFWHEVERACPNYKQHETWLKEHSRECVY